MTSGELVDHMFDDPESIVGFELIKGSFFVIVSAALIYFMIARHAERVLSSEIESIERLKQSEQRFRTLVDGITDHLIILLNARGEIRTWNPGAENLTGFSEREVKGRHYRILFPEEAQKEGLPEEILDNARSGPIATSGTRMRADGTSFITDGTISPVHDRDGSIAGFTKITRDLTEALDRQAAIEKSRQELEEERNRLRLILGQVPAILLVVDHDLIIQTVMGAGLRAFGRSNNETAGSSLTDFVPSDHPLLAAASGALAGNSVDVTMTYRERIFNLHVEPLRGADGSTITGAISLGRDVTDEVTAQQELVEKSRSLEKLSAQLIDAQENERERIARELHDEFGGLFTSLSFDVAWIRENASAPNLRDRAQDMTGRIDHAMKRVREVARELRPKVLDDFGLVPAIEDLVTSFSDRYGIETNLSSRSEEISLGKGLDIMLYRVIQEALTNIARHSGATRAEVRLRSADDHLVAEIRDDGRGIRPEDISGSSSLGIVGMRERTEILGGELSIEPYEGKGTIVRVTVPRRGCA